MFVQQFAQCFHHSSRSASFDGYAAVLALNNKDVGGPISGE
jgi:hypothetical protein